MKKKSRNILLIILASLIVLALGFFVYLYLIDKNKKDESLNEKPIYKDIIEGYGYTLEDRDTELFENTYIELKNVLESSEIDYENYAKLLAKLYIIDLYTIKNKVNQYDLGGTEYVYPEIKENFELKLSDTMYKYVIDNTEGKRTQNLPEVNTIIIKDIKSSKYTYLDTEFESYEVEIEWTYVEELEYDKTAIVKLIKMDNKLFIAEQK